MANFKSLSEANKTTASLHFSRLPQPLFKDNLQFVQQWNALIKDFQTKSMNLLIASNKDSIKITNDEILQLKKEMLTQTKHPDLVTSELRKIEASSKNFEADRNKEAFAKTTAIIESSEPTEYIYKPNTHQPRSSNMKDQPTSNSQSSHRRKSANSFFNKPGAHHHTNTNNRGNMRKSYHNNSSNQYFNNRNSNRGNNLQQEEN